MASKYNDEGTGPDQQQGASGMHIPSSQCQYVYAEGASLESGQVSGPSSLENRNRANTADANASSNVNALREARQDIIDVLTDRITFLTSIVMENNVFPENHDNGEVTKKGNKIQHQSNIDAIKYLDMSIFALKTKNLTMLEENLLKARKVLKARNKLICIADGSECGWDTVSAYQAHSAAVDEDDDRKIKRAETVARAQKKQRLEQSFRARGRATRGRGGRGAFGVGFTQGYGQNYGQYYGQNYGQNYQAYPQAYPQQGFVPNLVYHQPFSAQQYGFQMAQQAQAAPRPLVKCFGCQGYGHTRNACPAPQPSYAHAAPATVTK